MPKPNDKIGPYTLISKLGRGAFGVVWLAERRSTLATTKVALKLTDDEDLDLEAVKREASLWVHASGHQNVLPLIEADVYDDQVVIVSEYAPDGSLSKWLERYGGKAPSIESAVTMALGILAGLEHLHKRGIIHRDLKPDNILLQNDTPRLADFGIARILKTTSKSTMATGTPAYMPPEAFDGKRSERTDIWSVGVIFYQLLSGRLPFPQSEFTSLVGAILMREPEPLPDSIPQPIREIVERTLQKNPNERYGSASEMRQALSAAHRLQANSLSSETYPKVTIQIPSVPSSTAGQDTVASSAKASPIYPSKFKESVTSQLQLSSANLQKSNRKRWIIGMSLMILIVGVVLATFVFRTSNTPTANAPVSTPAVVRTSDGLLHRVNDEGEMVGIASPSEAMPPFLIRGWDETGTEAARASNRERMRKYQEIVQAWESPGLMQRVSEVNLNDLHDVHARLSGSDSKIEVFLGNEDFGNRLKFALDELDRQRNTPIGPFILNINVTQGIEKGNHVTIGVSPEAPNFSESNSNQSKPTEGKPKVKLQIGPLYATNADSSEKSYAGGNGMPVTIVTSEGRLTKKASGSPKAYVQFDNVPCDETITIIIADYPANSEEAMYYSSEPRKHYIKCGKPVVDLGAFNVMFME